MKVVMLIRQRAIQMENHVIQLQNANLVQMDSAKQLEILKFIVFINMDLFLVRMK